MRRFFAWASAAGDRVNPVAVKEFRQAAQSRWVVAILMLFLLLNLAVVGGYLMLTPQAGASAGGGRNVFLLLLGVLLVTCIGFVPLYTGIRFALERNDANIDLLFVTTISAGAIVRGKYGAAMALTLLIFSACMPFMTLTYLLRGIDLPTIFYILAFGFSACASANALAVFAGSVSGSWLLRGLINLAGLFGLLYLGVTTLVMAVGTLTFGAGMIVVGGVTWTSIGVYLLVEALGIGLMYVLAVAMLSPRLSNRMFVPRLYISATWLVGGVVLFVWSWIEATIMPFQAWVIGSVICFSFLTIESLGERDTWSPRVRRTIPRNRLLRLLAFLTYTGSAGGVLWYILLFALTMLAALACAEPLWQQGGSHLPGFWLGSLVDFWRGCGEAAMAFGFVLCYCLTTAAARGTLLRRVPTITLSVTAALFGAGAWMIPYLIAFFSRRDWDFVVPYFLVASPLVLATTDNGAKNVAGVVLIAWLALCVLLSAPWVIGQWRRFLPNGTPQ